METMEMLAVIDNIVKQNKLDVHKKFNSKVLGSNGFYSEAQAIAKDAINKIWELCVIGLNSGFTKDIKNDISELSKVVVALMQIKNGETKKLNNCKGQVDKVIITRKNNQTVADPRESMNSYITTTVGAIDSVIKNKQLFGTSIDDQMNTLTSVRAKLVELQAKLANVSNYSSKQAAQMAMQITKIILDVRLQLTRLYITLKEDRQLDTALRIADEWIALAVASDRKNTAKKEDMPPEYQEDIISLMADSDVIFDKIELFRKRFAEAEARIMNPISVQNAQKRIADIDVEIAQIKAAQQEVVREYQNTGDRAKAERAAADLKAKLNALTKERENLQRQVSLNSKSTETRKKLVEKFKKGVYDPIMAQLQDDPIGLCVMVNMLDLGAILGLLGSNFTQEDVEAATRSLMNAQTMARRKLQNLITATQVVNDAVQWSDQREEDMLRDSGILEEEQSSVEQQVEQVSALDELLGEVTVAPTPTQNVQQNENQPTDTSSIPLTDDDK